MLSELLSACFLIFAAEMGDKTQILAMTFATKYTVSQVLIGVAIGAFFNHGLAVLLGSSLANFISLDLLRLIAGIVFVAFAFWSLIKREDDEDEEQQNKSLGPVFTVAMAFFIGELGDKTQLSAITLATSAQFPVFILAGTVLGMVLTSSIGIFVGSRMGKKIPELAMKIGSATVFLLFGIISLSQNVPQVYLSQFNVFIFLLVVLSAFTCLAYRAKKLDRNQPATKFKRTAHKLQQQLLGIQELVENMCLTEHKCGHCEGTHCLVGLIKNNLQHALDEEMLTDANCQFNVEMLVKKEFDLDTARKALCATVVACQDCGCEHEETCVLHQTRLALEQICFQKNLDFSGGMDAYLAELEQESPVLASRIRDMIVNSTS